MSSDYVIEAPKTEVLDDIRHADRLKSPENPETKMGIIPSDIRATYLIRMSRTEFHDEVLKTIKWFFSSQSFKGKEVTFRLQFGSAGKYGNFGMLQRLDERLHLRTTHSLIYFVRRGILAKGCGNNQRPRYVLIEQSGAL